MRRGEIRWRLARLLVYAGLPIAVIMAAAMIARAYDTSWIAAKQPISASSLKANLDEIQRRFAGTEPCPVGYVKDANVMNYTVCKGDGLSYGGTPHPAVDEMVKVGSGLSAFWIDRYEASVWQNADGTGMQYGATGANGQLVPPDYPATFPRNGQRAPATMNFTDVYALSKAGVQPSANITWFQAQQACRASGKRLPTDEEWQAAASGTQDRDGPCQINAMNTGPRATGSGGFCISAWGAQDMIGNVWELTDEWYAGLGAAAEGQSPGISSTWARPEYNADGLSNIASSASDSVWHAKHPAEALRGGSWSVGPQAGVFALDLFNAPSYWTNDVGFRCVARGM